MLRRGTVYGPQKSKYTALMMVVFSNVSVQEKTLKSETTDFFWLFWTKCLGSAVSFK